MSLNLFPMRGLCAHLRLFLWCTQRGETNRVSYIIIPSYLCTTYHPPLFLGFKLGVPEEN